MRGWILETESESFGNRMGPEGVSEKSKRWIPEWFHSIGRGDGMYFKKYTGSNRELVSWTYTEGFPEGREVLTLFLASADSLQCSPMIPGLASPHLSHSRQFTYHSFFCLTRVCTRSSLFKISENLPGLSESWQKQTKQTNTRVVW